MDNWGGFFNIVWLIFLLLLFVPLLHKRLFEQAKEMGLPVSDRMPREIYGLMDLYPQATQRRPSVEFIPAPYLPPMRPTRKGEQG